MADGGVLEFVIRVLGGPTAAASAREVAGALNSTAAAQGKANAAAKGGIAANAGLARALKYTGLAAIGVAFEATKMGVNFDAAMERIHTQAGATQGEVNRMSRSILAMAGRDVMQGPQELAAGLYHLESIGLRGKKALDALHIAADGAAVGGANLEDTATALGSAWLVNIKGAGNLRHVMGVMNATVGAGNVRMEDLVQALGTGLLPAAKQAGLSLQDTMGALAVFTDEGYNASSAAAQFSTSLHFLYNPTAKAAGALKDIGLSGHTLAEDMHKPQGLLVALRDLKSHLDTLPGGARGIKAEQVLGDILPGGRGRILLTLLNQLDRYQGKLKQIGQTAGNFNQDVAATQATAAYRLHAAWSRVQASMIDLYHVLRPLFIPALLAVAAAASGVVSLLNYLVHGSGVVHDLVLALTFAFGSYALALGIATVATTALSVALGILEFLISPAGLIVLGLAAIAFAAIEVIHHWGAVKGALGGVWRWMATAAKNTANAVKGAFVGAINWIIRAWDSLHFTLPHINLGPLGTFGGNTISVPHINQIDTSPGGGAAMPKRAVPAKGLPGGIFGPPQQINVVVDGQVLARAMHRQTQSQQARGG